MSFVIPSLPLAGAGAVFAVLMLAILVAPFVARLLRLPEVVAFVLVGFVIGPTGLGLLERAGVVATLGGAGLLYLMFVAGLELDLDDFVAHRRDSIGFGVATFVIPMGLGTLVALGLGYPLLPSLLLGSCWASHTLVTYPIFQRVGTAGSRSVATSVGATIITDTAALLVLAVVARAWQGALTPLFWVTLLPSLAIVTFGAIAGLPRLTRWFFSGIGQVRSLRFLFVLAVLFGMSAVFEMIGVEAIVGAFLAGMAMNRAVPNGGALMERIDFFGGTIFIPLFLLATGMLIDLQVLVDPRTLLVGGAFTAVALVAKFLAAWVVGRFSGYVWPEIGAMFALSSAQAAATLAAVVVGLNVGLLDDATVNAVMLVILVTCVAAPLVAVRTAPLLPRPERGRDLGEVVILPVVNPANTVALAGIASSFARADGGLVVPVMVVPSESDAGQLAAARALEDDVVAAAQSAGAEARGVLRIDSSPALGIRHTISEQDASLLIVGWNGEAGRSGTHLGAILDRVITTAFVPTLVVREGAVRPTRVLVLLDESVTTPAGAPAVTLALRTAAILAREHGAPIEVFSNHDDAAVSALAQRLVGMSPVSDARRRSIIIKDRVRAGDVVLLPALADDAHLRAIATRITRATPPDAALVMAFDTSQVGVVSRTANRSTPSVVGSDTFPA